MLKNSSAQSRAFKVSGEAARLSLPHESEQQWNAHFASSCPPPFTGGQVAACVKLLMLSKCQCLSYFSPETAGEQGEHCSCKEWLQVVSLSDSYFHAVQTGTYGCNNKRGRTSFPPVLLNLSAVTLTHCQAHVWRGHVRGTDTQLK